MVSSNNTVLRYMDKDNFRVRSVTFNGYITVTQARGNNEFYSHQRRRLVTALGFNALRWSTCDLLNFLGPEPWAPGSRGYRNIAKATNKILCAEAAGGLELTPAPGHPMLLPRLKLRAARRSLLSVSRAPGASSSSSGPTSPSRCRCPNSSDPENLEETGSTADTAGPGSKVREPASTSKSREAPTVRR